MMRLLPATFFCLLGRAEYCRVSIKPPFGVNKIPGFWQILRDNPSVRLYTIELVFGRYPEDPPRLGFHTAHVTTLRVTNED